MGCIGSTAQHEDGECAAENGGQPPPRKKLKKPKAWKHAEGPLSRSELKRKREEFWDTSPHYGGRPEIWDALKAASEADLAMAQTIVDSAGIIVVSDDLSHCYDERGGEYNLPNFVLSEPSNIKDD